MDPSSFFISTVDTATTVGLGNFIYESRSGRVFFLNRKTSACKDEDPRYCPVCGNLRKEFAANEAGRQRLTNLLTEDRPQEPRSWIEQALQIKDSDDGPAAFIASTSSLPRICQLAPVPKVVVACKKWQRRETISQQEGIFSTSQSRGPPRP